MSPCLEPKRLVEQQGLRSAKRHLRAEKQDGGKGFIRHEKSSTSKSPKECR